MEKLTCGECGGTGQIPYKGSMQRCDRCRGAGVVYMETETVRCKRCNGFGSVRGMTVGAGHMPAYTPKSSVQACSKCKGTGVLPESKVRKNIKRVRI